MTKGKIVYIQLSKRICLFLLGIILLYIPVDLSCAEEMEGLTVSSDQTMDDATHHYMHTPEKEMTVECSLFDIRSLYLYYHQYSEDGYMLEYPMDAEDIVITKDGEPAGSLIDVADSPVHQGEICFRFKEPGDYVISSSRVGFEESSVTIHAELPTTGFFTEPYCSNRNRNYFSPYEDNNVIYYILPENTKLNDNEKVNDGYPISVNAWNEGAAITINGEVASRFCSYELVEGSSRVYKLTISKELLETECDTYDISVCYNSIDSSVDWEWQWDMLRVGEVHSDQIGLLVTRGIPNHEFTGEMNYDLQKSITYYLTHGKTSCYFAYYDYDEECNLIETIPELDDIRIEKDGMDVTNNVYIGKGVNGLHELMFPDSGMYRLIVTLEDGREDAVNIHVESYEEGFYDSAQPDSYELYSFRLSDGNNVVYYALSEKTKLAGDTPFSITVNGEKIPAELQSRYFSYELVEGSNTIYKIMFQTTNDTAKQFRIEVYYEYGEGRTALLDSLEVVNHISAGLTVGTDKWTEESTGKIVHDIADEFWVSCSLFEIQYLYICYHEYDDNNNLIEYQLKAEELVITKDGEVVGTSVDVVNNTYRKDCTTFRFKEPGDYVISSAIEGQKGSFVTIHVSEPDTGFFTEPVCSNKERSYFHPYENENVIYYIIPENTRLLDNENILDGSPIDFCIETENGREQVEKDKIKQYFSFEELEENSRIYRLTFNLEKLDTIQACDIYIYYESTNGEFDSMRNGYLRVGGEDGDKIGLMIATERDLSKFTGKLEYDMQKEITACTKFQSEDPYQIVFYDYNEKNELIEMIPDVEDIKIMKDSIDVTEAVGLSKNSDGSFEMLFQEKGKYRLFVTLEDGRKDMVDIYARNLLHGFYTTPEVEENALQQYELTRKNNVVYFILADDTKINEEESTNGGYPFKLVVNGNQIPQELQEEYFTYELVEGTDKVYKITLQTDKGMTEFSTFDLYAYYGYIRYEVGLTSRLQVINAISDEEPTTEIPVTEMPATEEATTEELTTETPTTEEPATEEPTTETPAIGGTVGEQETLLSLSDVVVNSIDEQIYRAQGIEPGITVSYQGKQLTLGRDYTVEYKNNTSAGTADVILTGIGDYSGTREVHFQIKPYQVEGLSEILKGSDGKIYSAVYTKKKIMLKTAFKLSYMVGTKRHYLEPQEGTDYSVQYYNNNKIGTARIIYSFKGNYAGTVVKKFLIVPPATKITKVKKSGKDLVISCKKISSCDRYEIYRATSKKGRYKKIATVKGKNKISYKDKKVEKGKKYYYKVIACKKVSGTLYKSDWSNVIKGKR